jgi:hypothetical protein
VDPLLKTIVFTIVGFLFLGLAMIGLFLPILPTTPFVLVSVGCFSSAPRIRSWILKSVFFKEHIENYERRIGLSPKTVRISLGWLWGMLLLSMLLIQQVWSTIGLPLIGVAVTAHILCMSRTKNGKKGDQP